ncbi:hypothetical protein Pmani_024830 [Petrolisthes manimaculis]|uniref:J domain-containing protein n=1 Tax=Petrolisthes manimaculis TaxID=1843537 RepID=A0AAE1P7K1_9EUCA|nr:hypothetical protein Pmani_024830 [Petrolisthes manimaculis]
MKPHDIHRRLDEHDIMESGTQDFPCKFYSTDVGSYLDERFLHLLDNSFGDFNDGEIVCMKKYVLEDDSDEEGEDESEEDNTFVIVKVLCLVEESCVCKMMNIYEVSRGFQDPTLTVEAYRLYRFVRTVSNTVVPFTGTREETEQERTSTVTEEELRKQIRKQVIEIWQVENEKDRKSLLRRLMFQWHPDKNPDRKEMYTRLFQYIQSLVGRLERGETIPEKDTDSDSAPGPSQTYEHTFRPPPPQHTFRPPPPQHTFRPPPPPPQHTFRPPPPQHTFRPPPPQYTFRPPPPQHTFRPPPPPPQHTFRPPPPPPQYTFRPPPPQYTFRPPPPQYTFRPPPPQHTFRPPPPPPQYTFRPPPPQHTFRPPPPQHTFRPPPPPPQYTFRPPPPQYTNPRTQITFGGSSERFASRYGGRSQGRRRMGDWRESRKWWSHAGHDLEVAERHLAGIPPCYTIYFCLQAAGKFLKACLYQVDRDAATTIVNIDSLTNLCHLLNLPQTLEQLVNEVMARVGGNNGDGLRFPLHLLVGCPCDRYSSQDATFVL